jgi:SAM-dependent methyltransferase
MPLRKLVRRRLPRNLDPELEAELGSPVHWMYPWQITRRVSVSPPAELASIHTTRLEMIEPVAHAALAVGGPDASVLDLGCNEGWFAHRALDWGAARVVGIDVRASNLRRATLVRDHYGIPEERLRFERSDVHELDVQRLGRFDLVLDAGPDLPPRGPDRRLAGGARAHARDDGGRVAAVGPRRAAQGWLGHD